MRKPSLQAHQPWDLPRAYPLYRHFPPTFGRGREAGTCSTQPRFCFSRQVSTFQLRCGFCHSEQSFSWIFQTLGLCFEWKRFPLPCCRWCGTKAIHFYKVSNRCGLTWTVHAHSSYPLWPFSPLPPSRRKFRRTRWSSRHSKSGF